MTAHLSDGFQELAGGFGYATCICGWHAAPFPDLGSSVDALMEHAAERAAVEAPTAQRLAAVLDDLLDTQGPCDHYDHHGDCQAHYIENPCSVAIATAVLFEYEETQ